MKRELILIRHTKSSWKEQSLPDFERPLKKDRVDDAKKMGKRLKSLGIIPDLIISSPAVRAAQTTRYFCKELHYPYSKVHFDNRIYASDVDAILEVVRETPHEVKCLLVIGHNPSLTLFANSFGNISVDDIPTTGVVWIEFESADWGIYRATPCRVKAVMSPKTI